MLRFFLGGGRKVIPFYNWFEKKSIFEKWWNFCIYHFFFNKIFFLRYFQTLKHGANDASQRDDSAGIFKKKLAPIFKELWFFEGQTRDQMWKCGVPFQAIYNWKYMCAQTHKNNINRPTDPNTRSQRLKIGSYDS